MTPSLPDILAVRPFTRPARGAAAVPGSKSLTNRAMLLSALCDGPVTLTGALLSEDTEIMAEALRRLGFNVEEDEASCLIRVDGRSGAVPATDADLFVGLAGTAARFLTALCASAKRGTFKIDGIAQMRKRPMKGLIDPVAELDRLAKRLRKAEIDLSKLEVKLGNAQFAKNAPPEIVAKDQQRLEELRTEIGQLSAQTARVTKLKNQ